MAEACRRLWASVWESCCWSLLVPRSGTRAWRLERPIAPAPRRWLVPPDEGRAACAVLRPYGKTDLGFASLADYSEPARAQSRAAYKGGRSPCSLLLWLRSISTRRRRSRRYYFPDSGPRRFTP